MIVVDSSVWIAFFNDDPIDQADRLEASLTQKRIVVGDLILTEVLQGFRNDRQHDGVKALLLSLEVEEMAGEAAALDAAAAYRKLRRRGVTPRSTIDVLIACHCVRHGHQLMHADRDFDLMAGPLGLVTADPS